MMDAIGNLMTQTQKKFSFQKAGLCWFLCDLKGD
jgi:hypothetical protein